MTGYTADPWMANAKLCASPIVLSLREAGLRLQPTVCRNDSYMSSFSSVNYMGEFTQQIVSLPVTTLQHGPCSFWPLCHIGAK
jgi:hypothetical protein